MLHSLFFINKSIYERRMVTYMKYVIEKKKRKSDDWKGYLFIAPWLTGFVIFMLIPCVYTLGISFTNWDMFSAPRFVGFHNYINLLEDELFLQSIWVTVRFVFCSVGISIVLALGLALLLNVNSGFMYVFRTIFYIPSVVSGIAVAIVWGWIFSPDFGIVNYLLSLIGVRGPDWLGDPTFAPWAFIIIMCTTFIGAPMIIFLAGLQNIPACLYESASIDGAGTFQKLKYITLPELKPIIVFNIVTMVIGAFRTFVQAYTLAGKSGNPRHSLLFFVMYLYNKAFSDMDMGSACAMAWVFFSIVFVFTVLILKLSKNNEKEEV